MAQRKDQTSEPVRLIGTGRDMLGRYARGVEFEAPPEQAERLIEQGAALPADITPEAPQVEAFEQTTDVRGREVLDRPFTPAEAAQQDAYHAHRWAANRATRFFGPKRAA